IEAHDGHVFVDGRRLNEPYLPAGIQIKPLARQVVPGNSIFVMGDNRPSSKDSTVFGPISKNLVVGRAFLRVWPLSAIKFL
ncbi:MAG: signal peptidase I, partial [Actinobacteria bacterium]